MHSEKPIVINIKAYSHSTSLTLRFLTELHAFKFGKTEAQRHAFSQGCSNVIYRDFEFIFEIFSVRMARTPVDTQHHTLRLLDTGVMLCLKPERAEVLPRLIMINYSPISSEITMREILDRLVDAELTMAAHLRVVLRSVFWKPLR